MGYDGDGRGWGMGDSMGWFGWVMMTSLVLIGVALLVVLVWAVLRGTTANPGPGVTGGAQVRPRSAARLVLDERFARGEIDQSEYEQRARALHSG